MIATNIVEEGVDVPSCNMIVRYSRPVNFGSYTQSKGRARSAHSTYYILVDQSQSDQFEAELQNFIEIENVS